jgi:TfoX/Sxy family transcriptional regulator of competence genes
VKVGPTISGMAYDEVLGDRVREKLRSSPGVAEKRMFGGIAFLTHGNMTVGVRGHELIVRISPDDTDAALAEPGVRVFDVTGRPMRGWILVAGERLDDDELDRWIAQAKTFVATQPPK